MKLDLKEILLVEDNAIISYDLADSLLEAGARKVHVAARCDEAIALLERESIQCALCDLFLADGDCRPVLEQLRTRKIPFIFISGVGEERATGAPDWISDYGAPSLPKPFSPVQLLRALEDLIKPHNG